MRSVNIPLLSGFLLLLVAYGSEARCYDKYNAAFYETGAKFKRDKPMGETTLKGTYDCTCRRGGMLYCYAFDIPCYDEIRKTFIPKGERFSKMLGGYVSECTCIGGRSAFRNCIRSEPGSGCRDIITDRNVLDGEYYTTRRFGAEVSCRCEGGRAARASCESTGCRDQKTESLVHKGQKYYVESYGIIYECTCGDGGEPQRGSCRKPTDVSSSCRDDKTGRSVRVGQRYHVKSYGTLFECTCGSKGEPQRGTCRKPTSGVDVDPCRSSPCHGQATCTARGGSYRCSCNTGYRGNGRSCLDIDECAGFNRCHTNANCDNTEGSYSCTCEPGYKGDGYQCTRHDPCDEGVVFCHMNAECRPNESSFQCICSRGYTGDGFTCQDLDECSVGAHDCDEYASCINTFGRYTCSCNEGYEGDGRECKKMCRDDANGLYVANHDVFAKINDGRLQTCTCQDGEAIEGSCYGDSVPEAPTEAPCADDSTGEMVSSGNYFLRRSGNIEIRCLCRDGIAVIETCTQTTKLIETSTPELTTLTSTTTNSITTIRTRPPTTGPPSTIETATESDKLKCFNRNNGSYYKVGSSYTWNRNKRSYLCVCTKRRGVAISRCRPVRYSS